MGFRVQLETVHLPSAVNASEDDIDLVLRNAVSFMHGKRYIKLIGRDANVTLGARMCDGQHIGPALSDSAYSSSTRLVSDFLANARLEAVNAFKTFWGLDRIQMDMPRPIESLGMDERATWRGNLFGQVSQKPLDYILLDNRSSHRMGHTRVRHKWVSPSDHSALGLEVMLMGPTWIGIGTNENVRSGRGRRRPKDGSFTTNTCTRTC